MGGEWSLGVALVMECWPEGEPPVARRRDRRRQQCRLRVDRRAGVCLSGHSPFVAMGDAGRRGAALLTFFIRLFVPESRTMERPPVKRRKFPDPSRKCSRRRCCRLTLLGIAFASICLIGTWASVQWIPLWVDQITHSTMPSAKAVAQVASALGAVLGCFAGSLARWLGRTPDHLLRAVRRIAGHLPDPAFWASHL